MSDQKHKQISYVKTLMLLSFSTLSVLLFSIGSTFMIERAFGEQRYEANTMIASTNIEGLSSEEARSLLEEEIAIWRNSATITLMYQENEVSLPLESVEFNVEESINLTQDGQQQKLLTHIDEAYLVEAVLQLHVMESSVDFETLNGVLAERIGYLPTPQIVFDVNEFLIKPDVAPETIASATLSDVLYSSEMRMIVDALDGYVIEPEEAFSMKEAINGIGLVKQNDYATSAVASALYEASIQTNFEIVERQTGKEQPSYTSLGFEAYVNSQHDLVVFNPNTNPYTLNLTFESNTLALTIDGIPLSDRYVIELSNERKLTPRTILRYSNDVAKGTTRTIQEGKDGYYVSVYQKQLSSNGALINRVLLSEDFYRPIHRIVERSLLEQQSGGNSTDGNGISNPGEEDLVEEENSDDPSSDSEGNGSDEVDPHPTKGEEPEVIQDGEN